MPIRQRKLIGAVLLLVLVIVWSLVGVAVAQAPVLKESRAWATATPASDQTITSTRSRTAPINFRWRMGMSGM